MIRLPLSLAAATLAIGLGSSYAQAQMPVAPTTPSMAQPAMPGAPGMAPMAPATGMAPPPPPHRGMQGRPMRGQQPRPMGAGMGAPQQPPMAQPPVIAGGMVQPPAQPFSNLNLPNTSVGDGAYGGGGMVLEYLPDGTRRIVQQ